MYSIYRFCKDGSDEYAEFVVFDGERLMDKLKETMYILHEEEPISRYWEYELRTEGITVISYHDTEFAVLEYNEATKTFTITETD